MAGIINPTKIGISLDVDGTLVDSNRECYQRVCEVWKAQYNQDFPLNYEQFHSFRPNVARVEDYFTFSKIMIENDGNMPENANELHEEYLKLPINEKLKDMFYDSRKSKMADDKEAWIKENAVYNGVPEMMADIGNTGWNIFVVTSKNKEAVDEILSYHGFDKNIQKIYDKEDGKRSEQFAKASQERGIEIKNIIPYDDLLKQLKAAKSMGMYAVAAPQGYGINDEIVDEGFTLSFPDKFIETVETHLKSR